MHNFIIPQFVDIIETAIAWFRFNPWPPRRGGGGGGRRPPRSIITAINVFADLYVLLSGSIQFFVPWFVPSALQSHYRCCNGCLLHSALAGRLSATTGLFIVSFPRFCLQLETVNWISFHLASESIVLCYLLRLNWPVLTRVFRKGLVAFVCFNRISPQMNSSPLWSFYGWTPILYSLDYCIKRIIVLKITTEVFATVYSFMRSVFYFLIQYDLVSVDRAFLITKLQN